MIQRSPSYRIPDLEFSLRMTSMSLFLVINFLSLAELLGVFIWLFSLLVSRFLQVVLDLLSSVVFLF